MNETSNGPTDQETTRRPVPPGLTTMATGGAVGPIEIGAAALSVAWVAGIALALALVPDTAGDGMLRVATMAMVIVVPVAMIWVAAVSLRAAQLVQAESLRLQAALDLLRKSYIAQSQRGATEPPLARRLDEIAAATRKSEAALAMLTSARAVQDAGASQSVRSDVPARPEPSRDAQPSLALGMPADATTIPLQAQDFIRALNFPETAEDSEGFAALRRALRDRNTAQIVQASQDILTLMSQDGIYMDDLRPEPARSETWRAFAAGTRGAAVASLGGIRDREALSRVSARMKQDPIFRDAGHHFLRVFDKAFAVFSTQATDAEIQAFATTRTARAFMLVGRVAGTFS